MTEQPRQGFYKPDIFILVGTGHFYFGLTNSETRLDAFLVSRYTYIRNVEHIRNGYTEMPIVKTSAKGQVVIPRAIRKVLGIKPGSRLHVRLEGKEVVLLPLADEPIRALRGILKGGPSLTKALLEDRREELEREEKKSARLFLNPGLASK